MDGDEDTKDQFDNDNNNEPRLAKIRDAIFQAIEDVDLNEVVRLVNEARERGDDVVNFGDEIGDSSLHRAAGTGSVEIIQFLVAAGADIHKCNANDDTPLHYACMFVPAEDDEMLEHFMMIEAMFAAGASSDWDFKNKESESPCSYAKDAFPPNLYDDLIKKSQEHAFIVPQHEDAALKAKKLAALGEDGSKSSIPHPTEESVKAHMKPRTIGRLQWLRRQLKQRNVSPAALFRAMDANLDGMITLGEFVEGLQAVDVHVNEFQSRQLYIMLDPNRDSRISWDELETVLMQDASKDGALELLADELEKKQLAGVDVAAEEVKNNYMEMLQLKEDDPEKIAERKRRQEASVVFQKMRHAIQQNRTVFGKKLNSAEDMFSALDTDGDGRVTVEEFHIGLKRMGLGLSDDQIRDVVYELDLDNDGEVAFEELIDALKQDFADFNPVNETVKRLEKAKKRAKEEERAISHLCGSFAKNKSTRIMMEQAAKRKLIEARITRERENRRRKLTRRRQHSLNKWGQVLARSPYGIDLHAEQKMIMKAHKRRNRMESKVKKRREKRRLACLGKVILEAISDSDRLDNVRAERRELALEEARLKALVDLERARRMGMNSKFYKEELNRKRIRARIEKERNQQNRTKNHGRPMDAMFLEGVERPIHINAYDEFNQNFGPDAAAPP
eukprot:g4578.t1